MRFAAALSALLVVVILAGCSGIDVSTDFNREWDFSPYKTYDWVAIKSPTLRDPLLDTSLLERRIKNAVERELEIKGYSRSEVEPDFLISYHVASQRQVDVSTCGYHYPTSPHCWGREIDAYTYTEGTLLLDFIDFKQEELVWRASAKSSIYEHEEVEKTLNEAVKKMLEDFPPS